MKTIQKKLVEELVAGKDESFRELFKEYIYEQSRKILNTSKLNKVSIKGHDIYLDGKKVGTFEVTEDGVVYTDEEGNVKTFETDTEMIRHVAGVGPDEPSYLESEEDGEDSDEETEEETEEDNEDGEDSEEEEEDSEEDDEDSEEDDEEGTK